MRKLVTTQRIKEVLPIEGADLIELVTFHDVGWQCVSKKGEFAPEDTAIYFEIDSFLPASDGRFTFLKDQKNYFGMLGYRINTIKLRGTLSQGLALPVRMFSEVKLHKDIAEQLGVIKYDLTLIEERKTGNVLIGKSAGNFPSFIPKTDQERIQNLPRHFTTYEDNLFEETLKLDGSSMTCYKIPVVPTLWQRIKALFGIPHKTYHFGVCSRNIEIKPSDNYVKTFGNNGTTSTYAQSDFWGAAAKYAIEQNLPEGYAIQGELIGPKIQSNYEKVQYLEFYVFDIYNIKEARYLTPAERHSMMSGTLQRIPHVPIVNRSVKIFEECPTLSDLLVRVEGESMNKGTTSEGRVYKSHDGKVTFKVISNKYLLNKER